MIDRNRNENLTNNTVVHLQETDLQTGKEQKWKKDGQIDNIS